MAKFGQLILTSLGIAAQYNSQAGKQLKFKRIGMGSGKYSGDVSSLTKLISENVSIDISKGYMRNGVFVVEGLFSNEGLQTGFAWREIGLFIEDEKGKEILYCYANAGDSYDYIPATMDERYSKNVRIATAIGNATNISIVESEGLVCVDVRTFEAAVEELTTEINSLYPSKVMTGSFVQANDSAALAFVGMNLYGKSTQIKTTGKNLLDNDYTGAFTTINGITFSDAGDGKVRVEGTASANTTFVFHPFSVGERTPISAGTYTVSGNPTAGVYFAFYLYASQETSDILANNGAIANGNSWTFTINKDSYYGAYLYVGSGKTVSGVISPQLEKGYVATEYEPFTGGVPAPSPDYPQEIINSGDSGSVKVEVYGKNLLAYPYKETTVTKNGLTFTDNGDGSVEVNGTATNTTYFSFNDLPELDREIIVSGCPKNGSWSTYQISVDKNGLNHVNDYGGGVSVKCNKSDTYSLTLVIRKGTNVSNLVFRPQAEIKNNSVENSTEYEFYKEKRSLSISTPNGLAGIPVTSGGNYTDENGQEWICDEVDLERGVYVKRTNTADLGELEWYYNEPYAVFTAPVQDLAPDTLVMLCTHYLTSTMNSASSPDLTIYGRKDSYGIGGLGVKNSNYTNAATFKTAMAGAIVLYELKEPIETALADDEIAAYRALTSNNPNTTILADSGAEIAAEYVTQSHEGLVGMLLRRISELESTIGNINAILESVNGGE